MNLDKVCSECNTATNASDRYCKGCGVRFVEKGVMDAVESSSATIIKDTLNLTGRIPYYGIGLYVGVLLVLYIFFKDHD